MRTTDYQENSIPDNEEYTLCVSDLLPPLEGDALLQYEKITAEPYCFGKRLREEMERQDIKPPRMNELTKVNLRSIQHYIVEPGAHSKPQIPSVQSAALLANALGISLDYLSGLTDVPAPDAAQSMLLSQIGLRQEAADVLHTLTKESALIRPVGRYRVFMPWCRPSHYENEPELAEPEYKSDYLESALSPAELLEGIFSAENVPVLNSVLKTLGEYIVIRREKALAEQDKVREEKWLAEHPEAEIEYNENYAQSHFETLKNDERRARFDLMCYGEELLENLADLFPPTQSQRKAADKIIDTNHRLAERRGLRDQAFLRSAQMPEEEFIRGEMADLEYFPEPNFAEEYDVTDVTDSVRNALLDLLTPTEE